MEDMHGRTAMTRLKHPTAVEIIYDLTHEGIQLGDANLTVLQVEPTRRLSELPQADGIAKISWHGRAQDYVFECRARNTPQAIQDGLNNAKQAAAAYSLPPLLIAPYFSEDRLSSLRGQGVSGIDLSGNGVIIADDFEIWRSGQPNRFKESLPIRNIYRGTSSIFARCCLLQSKFDSLKELRNYAANRLYGAREFETNTTLSISTASKVAKSLQEELILRKSNGELIVIDADLLLERLRSNYRPSAGRRLEGKTALSSKELWESLQDASVRSADNHKSRYIATGLHSAAHYQVLSGPPKVSLYVDDLERVAAVIGLQQTRMFPNVELMEDTSDLVYFDAHKNERTLEIWASPIQTWIELATNGPREREAAGLLQVHLARSAGDKIV